MVCDAISGVRCGLDRWVRPVGLEARVGLEKGLEGRRIYIRGVRKKEDSTVGAQGTQRMRTHKGVRKKGWGSKFRNSSSRISNEAMLGTAVWHKSKGRQSTPKSWVRKGG